MGKVKLSFLVLYKIHVECGGRHFDRDTVFPDVYIWLHLIACTIENCLYYWKNDLKYNSNHPFSQQPLHCVITRQNLH